MAGSSQTLEIPTGVCEVTSGVDSDFSEAIPLQK